MARRHSRDRLARKCAEEIAETLGVEIVKRAAYTWWGTGSAAAWRIKENRYRARIAVNVEQEEAPYGLLETGPLDDPQHHEEYRRMGELGWIAQPIFGGLGSLHPILH